MNVKMKHKEKRKHLEDSHSVVDVHDKKLRPPSEAEPPDDTSGFPSVLVLLREYLGMLSSSNRDKHAELIHQGNQENVISRVNFASKLSH